MYYPFFDSTWLIVLPGLLIAIWAQFKVKAAFSKYSKVASQSGMTGAMVARAMLDGAGLRDVPIYRAQGSLTDHYDPVKRTLNLSQDVYDSCSIAALGVAALESGNYLRGQELDGARKVLSAAALTYVAAALNAILQLLRLLALAGRHSRD